MKSTRVAASFRDPAGYVFWREGRLFRAVGPDYAEDLRRLVQEDLLNELIDRQWLVPTTLVEDDLAAELAAEHGEGMLFLEHEPIEPITYPYEWSVAMLADAAVRTLEIQEFLLKKQYALKDASAFNIQFCRGQPVFIDVASIERPSRLDVWHPLGQFNRMFTFPLLLHRHRGMDLKAYFLPHLDGLAADEVVRAFGWIERFKPSLLLDVTLPWLMERKSTNNEQAAAKLREGNRDASAQLLNLGRLRRKIESLKHKMRPRGNWAGYSQDCHYAPAAEDAKKEIVAEMLAEMRPDTVLDLGSNTGDYSLLAAEYADKVISVDADEPAIDLLYRRLQESPQPVCPIVADITNPSPALGFRHAERESLESRIPADCVLALAVVHHLFVSGNLSFELIRDLLSDLATRHVLLEFVPAEDPMYKKLTQFRAPDPRDYRLAACRDVFEEKFRFVQERPIAASPRTMLLLEKRV